MWTYFVAALLVAYGPALVLFIMLVMPSSQGILVCICAAFFWLLANTITGFVWVCPAHHVYVHV